MPIGSETILVVEDEEAVRRTTQRALETLGYRVLLANDGDDALACFAEHDHEIDLVLTDLVMPKLGGPQLVEALRQRGHDPRVLYTSGYLEEERRDDAPGEDTLFLHKPWTLKELAVKVRQALDRGRPRKR